MALKSFLLNKLGGFIAIFIGILSIWEAAKLYPYRSNLLTGDQTFPGMIGLLLLFFGFSLFFKRKEDERKIELPSRRTLSVLFATIAILFIYCFLIKFVGYIVSTLGVSILLFRLIGNNRWTSSIISSVLITAVLFYLFIVLLKIPFPSSVFSL